MGFWKVHIEEEFNYKGYKCVVVFSERGYRAGYIGLPLSHEFSNISVDKAIRMFDMDKCHGGCNFSESAEYNFPIADKDVSRWLGFDCGHAGEGQDLNLMEEYFDKETFERNKKYSVWATHYKVTSKEDTEMFCKNFVDEIEKVLENERAKRDKDDTQMERD